LPNERRFRLFDRNQGARKSLEVRTINGGEIPRISRVIRSGDRRQDLLPGGYDVVVDYDEVWALDSSNDEVIRSEPQLVSFELEAGHTYRLEHGPPIDLDDARLLARDMRVSIVDLGSGQSVQLAAESRHTVVNTLVVSPILPLEGDASAAAAADGTEIATEEPAGEASLALSALELPKFWWKRASPEERAQFRSEIEE
jgi:uncharacterized protein YccT (UPF0319 family)